MILVRAIPGRVGRTANWLSRYCPQMLASRCGPPLHWSLDEAGQPEDHMISISMPADFPVSLGSLATVGGTMRRGLAMLDGTDGAARLIFARHGAHCRTAALDEWLAIVRVDPPLERGVQMLWMLDARTTSWPGGTARGRGSRAVVPRHRRSGPAGQSHPARRTAGRRTRGCRPGAGHHTLAARSKPVVLAIDTRLRGWPSPPPGEGGPRSAPWPRLAITASGVPRPLDFTASRRWL